MGQTALKVRAVQAALRKHASPRLRADLAPRYGIVVDDALGVPMAAMIRLAKQYAPDHALALALWNTGNYEARTVAAMVADPKRLTSAQMDAWCRDFDNWAIVDTVCFKLFDRSPHAWKKVDQWAKRKPEFQKRAAFALLASLALHDKVAGSQEFIDRLPLIERAAADDRNFVKKAVSWALRSIGTRRAAARTAAVDLARRLAASDVSSARWIGKDALRELARSKS